jgi:hypothetical protein
MHLDPPRVASKRISPGPRQTFDNELTPREVQQTNIAASAQTIY